MGGCTITKVGDNIEELLAVMKRQIISASKSGLWVDSALILIDPFQNIVHIYDVEYAPLGTEIILKEVEEGKAFHVGVAGRYGEHPKKGQIVATVHVHS